MVNCICIMGCDA